MRSVVKKRIVFLVIAVAFYTFGFQTIPLDINLNSSLKSLLPFYISVFNYFLFIPVLYWFLIIKAGKQKSWKLLIILSISATCARFSFPTFIAEYFEFVMWLRYPIIAILLIIELYLIKTVFTGLWKARKLKGDPRIHAFTEFKDNDKKLTAALFISWEPAGWYYSIPSFSKQHPHSIGNLSLLSANVFHWLALASVCISLSTASYCLIFEWSELVAIIVSSIILWSLIAITANYRISKKYSIYISNEYLIINNSFWGFVAVKLSEISKVEAGNFIKNKNELSFGRGKELNIRLAFRCKQSYVGGMGSFPEEIKEIKMNVADPKMLAKKVQETMIK
ncbi:MAG: hypothetical protein COB38_08960 [Gammaproteobacteria bacterium]|nr:MAG: hypothetical protein COB38_08960 [Gammaproteobacteria bacterium]